MSIASFFGKRPRDESSGGPPSASEPQEEPRVLCAWNANSLLQRIQKDDKLVRAFLAERKPDIIFVSEVRMAAAAPPGAKRGDAMPRRRGELSKGTKDQVREAESVVSFLRSVGYRSVYSLSDSKYAGGALLIRRGCVQPTNLHFSLDPAAPSTSHHPEGRVIGCSFPSFDLLGTYSPNNGTTEESFQRRRQWDADMEAYLTSRRAASGGKKKPQVWLGDLNVAATWECVGPDPSWFRDKNSQEAADPDDRGQPGFTLNEQKRFKALMERADLVDAYRLQHPQADWRKDSTWRGTPGRDGVPEAGRYYGKGMRIDYVLVSPSLAPRVVDAVVHGVGPEREGFLGSDHCPLLVTLAAEPEAPAQEQGSTSGSGAVVDAAATTTAAVAGEPVQGV